MIPRKDPRSSAFDFEADINAATNRSTPAPSAQFKDAWVKVRERREEGRATLPGQLQRLGPGRSSPTVMTGLICDLRKHGCSAARIRALTLARRWPPDWGLFSLSFLFFSAWPGFALRPGRPECTHNVGRPHASTLYHAGAKLSIPSRTVRPARSR